MHRKSCLSSGMCAPGEGLFLHLFVCLLIDPCGAVATPGFLRVVDGVRQGMIPDCALITPQLIARSRGLTGPRTGYLINLLLVVYDSKAAPLAILHW